MKGRFMKLFNPVGNAHVFLVVEESDTGAQYGLHLVLSDQFMTYTTDYWEPDEFKLRGTVLEKETFELKKGLELLSKIPIMHSDKTDFEYEVED